MTKRSSIIVGTRASELALVQTTWVVTELSRRLAGVSFEVHKLTTRGDREQTSSRLPGLRQPSRRSPLSSMGSTGVFTSELERALLADEIDVAVHSFKDLPTALTEGLVVAAVPERANPYDALVLKDTGSLRELPAGGRVGVGSPRRREALLCVRDDLDLVALRGNVDTRLAKLRNGEYDALVMAKAALDRLGRTETSESLETVMLPAPAQGALAVQVRSDDESTRERVALLHDVRAGCEVLAEREVLRGLGGGCHLPLGVLARADRNGLLTLRAQIYQAREVHEFADQGETGGACELAAGLVERMRFDFPDGIE